MKRLFCRHRVWYAQDPIASDFDDEHITVTWTKMTCAGCGKVRNENVLKPREEVIVTWE